MQWLRGNWSSSLGSYDNKLPISLMYFVADVSEKGSMWTDFSEYHYVNINESVITIL